MDTAVNPCREFFDLEVKARILAAPMQVLEIDDLNAIPPESILPRESKEYAVPRKKELLRNIASQVVDKFVLQKDKIDRLLNKVLTVEEIENVRQQDQTEDGRFKCRFPGCDKTFAYNGKSKKTHEAAHDPPVTDDVETTFSSTIPAMKKKQPDENDDMYNYQCSCLEYGMIVLNFFGAIKEGDGKRIVRCWKFQLPYLRNDPGSTKYSLEALNLVFQENALLSPRDAHRLMWNRSVCSKPGHGNNIPLDLSLEFHNRLLKEVVKKLGPNANNPKSIDRYCRAVDGTKVVIENFDKEISLAKRSGIHVKTSIVHDLHKIVAELVSQKAFVWSPSRAYYYYSNFRTSLLENLDMQDMFKWINKHKKNILLAKKAR